MYRVDLEHKHTKSQQWRKRLFGKVFNRLISLEITSATLGNHKRLDITKQPSITEINKGVRVAVPLVSSASVLDSAMEEASLRISSTGLAMTFYRT